MGDSTSIREVRWCCSPHHHVCSRQSILKSAASNCQEMALLCPSRKADLSAINPSTRVFPPRLNDNRNVYTTYPIRCIQTQMEEFKQIEQSLKNEVFPRQNVLLGAKMLRVLDRPASEQAMIQKFWVTGSFFAVPLVIRT
jgi:hypothetical protein